jgi:membrane fusion protein (multidrug efflux system)
VLSNANLETARAEAQIAEANLRTAAAGRDLARQRIEDAHIRAPIDGVLQNRTQSIGDYAVPSFSGSGGPSGGGNIGSGRGPIFTLIQTDPLLLEVNVSEQDAPDARNTAEKLVVSVDAFPGEEFSGTVDYVAPSLDPVAFTQLIRLRVPNPNSQLKPGMFARIEVVRYVADEGLVISADALVDLGDSLGVYVVDDQQVAHLVGVQTHFISGNEVALAAGLEEGDQVITEGKSSVREGTEVRLIFGDLRTGS